MKRKTVILDFLIDANFQGVNRSFVLSFKDSRRQYYLPIVEM